MDETDYLLRSPANAARLTAAADEVRSGRELLGKTVAERHAATEEELIVIQARYHYDG